MKATLTKLLLTKIAPIAALLSLSASPAFAVDFQCYDLGAEKVAEYLEYSSTEDFLKENELIFSCKTKGKPDREILQWGDGSGLAGIEFDIQNGVCVMTVEPFSGQDDGDLDPEWEKANCQGF